MKVTSHLFALTNKTTFTFRELRSFRAFYISQNFRNTSNQCLGVSPAKIPQRHKHEFTYMFYGNAEAISPAQRRRFRESQRTFPFFSDLNITKFSTESIFSEQPNQPNFRGNQGSSRKLSLFSTKRTKQIYAFSHFQSMRYLLYGSTLSIKFVINNDNLHNNADQSFNKKTINQREISKSLSFFNSGNFHKIMSSRVFFEPFFKFFTTYRQVQTPSRQGYSIYRINQIKNKSFFESPRQSSDIRSVHLQFLEQIFSFSDVFIHINELLGHFAKPSTINTINKL